MSAPTKKCEICGEDVPNLKFKKHMQAHSESEIAEKVEEKVVVQTPKAQDKQKVTDEMGRLAQIALAAQNKFLEAPDMFFGEDSTDQHAALVRVHCPEALVEDPEWTAVFGTAAKRLDGYAAKAYDPIVDENRNIVTDEGGNPMFRVRTDIYNGRKSVFQKESTRRLHNVTQEGIRKSSASGLAEEELTITKTKT